MKEVRIIIAGGRDYDDWNLLCNIIDNYLKDIYPMYKLPTIISGGCKGADELGERYAEYFGYELKRFPADWYKYGKAAGPIRNAEMAKYAVADGSYGVLFAFWDCKSKGTENMIETAEKYGLEVHIISY